jgi:hypothetical protein
LSAGCKLSQAASASALIPHFTHLATVRTRISLRPGWNYPRRTARAFAVGASLASTISQCCPSGRDSPSGTGSRSARTREIRPPKQRHLAPGAGQRARVDHPRPALDGLRGCPGRISGWVERSRSRSGRCRPRGTGDIGDLTQLIERSDQHKDTAFTMAPSRYCGTTE